MVQVVVTRHPALVEYLIGEGVVPEGTKVLAHVTPDDVRGMDVFGVLPLHLAALARSVTEIPLNVPAELRGVELTLDQVRQYAGPATTYVVATERHADVAFAVASGMLERIGAREALQAVRQADKPQPCPDCGGMGGCLGEPDPYGSLPCHAGPYRRIMR